MLIDKPLAAARQDKAARVQWPKCVHRKPDRRCQTREQRPFWMQDAPHLGDHRVEVSFVARSAGPRC